LAIADDYYESASAVPAKTKEAQRANTSLPGILKNQEERIRKIIAKKSSLKKLRPRDQPSLGLLHLRIFYIAGCSCRNRAGGTIPIIGSAWPLFTVGQLRASTHMIFCFRKMSCKSFCTAAT
jgi:hypothetical protein